MGYMRCLAVLVGGILAGSALASVVLSSRSDPPANPANAKLRTELYRARAEASRLRAALSATLARTGRKEGTKSAPNRAREEYPRLGNEGAKSGDPASSDAAPASSDAVHVAERRVVAAKAGELLRRDPEIRQLYDRFSRDEGGFPHWSSAHFLEDSAINPRELALTEKQQEEFELLFARAHQQIRILDLRRQRATAEAVIRVLEARIFDGEQAEPFSAYTDDAIAVSISKDLEVMLPRDECPEIALLREEKKSAIVDWLLEAQQFFASAE